MSLLHSPIRFRKVQLKNRLVVSPMCQYSSEDGFANNWHLVHLGSRAVGGAGLVFTEAIAVNPAGRITPQDLGIWKDEHIPFLKIITDFIKQQGSVPGTQLAHAGRKASHDVPWNGSKPIAPGNIGWIPQAPSEVKYGEEDNASNAMTRDEIKECIRDFASAARRSVQAGFEIIEIHAAHGYLLNEFMSPLSNKRTDEYGGNFENRIRLLLEITNEIRNVIGDPVPVFVRISATEWVAGGWSIEDSVALGKLLREAGVDLIDCSTGGNSRHQQIDAHPLFQVPYSEQIKRDAAIATGAVGIITEAQEAELILEKQQADLIFIGRELLRNPYFPLSSAAVLGDDIPWPQQYARAKN